MFGRSPSTVGKVPEKNTLPSLMPQTMAPMITRLPALDGARGIAVLLVLLDHGSDAEMRVFAGADVNRAGKYGVYLFFVLSAFLLTCQFAAWQPAHFAQPRRWLNYAFRRFIRIFPVYVSVLIAYVLMGKLDLHDLPPHLLLREGVHQFWTIPVECKFYLLLPFIACALFWAGRKSWRLGLAALLAVGALAVGLNALDALWSVRGEVRLLKNLPPFLFGSALAVGYTALQRHPRGHQASAPWLKLASVIAALAILLRLPLVNEALFAPLAIFSKDLDPTVCGLLWSIFLLGAIQPTGLLSAVMQWRPLRYLGMISFSAYLWHRKFINDIDDFPASSPVRLLVFLIVVIAVASVSYFVLERPLQKLRLRTTPLSSSTQSVG